MYPFVNEAMRASVPRTQSERYIAVVVNRELSVGSSVRSMSGKDTLSSKLRIKPEKTADLDKENNLRLLRKQIKSLSEPLREYARSSWTHEQDQKRKELQDFQCMLICHLHKILMKSFVSQGLDPKTYRIGGNDRRTYGKFPIPVTTICFVLLFPHFILTLFLRFHVCRTFLSGRTFHANDQTSIYHCHATMFW